MKVCIIRQNNRLSGSAAAHNKTFTVSQLIKALQDMPQDMPIFLKVDSTYSTITDGTTQAGLDQIDTVTICTNE